MRKVYMRRLYFMHFLCLSHFPLLQNSILFLRPSTSATQITAVDQPCSDMDGSSTASLPTGRSRAVYRALWHFSVTATVCDQCQTLLGMFLMAVMGKQEWQNRGQTFWHEKEVCIWVLKTERQEGGEWRQLVWEWNSLCCV